MALLSALRQIPHVRPLVLAQHAAGEVGVARLLDDRVHPFDGMDQLVGRGVDLGGRRIIKKKKKKGSVINDLNKKIKNKN